MLILLTFFASFNSKNIFFLKWCPIFDDSALSQFTLPFKCDYFLPKNLTNFVSLPWKLDNPYCYIEITTYFNVFNAISSLSFSLYLLSLIRHKKYLAQNSICCFRINWLRPDVGLVKKWVSWNLIAWGWNSQKY